MINYTNRMLITHRIKKTNTLNGLKQVYDELESHVKTGEDDLKFLQQCLVTIIEKINNLHKRKHQSINKK